MFCRNCGNEIENGVLFCRFCGQKLNDTTDISAKQAVNAASAAAGGDSSFRNAERIRREPGGNMRKDPVSDNAATKKRNNTGLVIAVAVVALLLVVVGVLIFALSEPTAKKDKKRAEQEQIAERNDQEPSSRKEGRSGREDDDEPSWSETELQPWTGAVNWRGGDWTNRDDILPHKNEEGYIVFGAYGQVGDESEGPEPIEWEILEESSKGMLLVSRYVLEVRPYHDEEEDVTWEKCRLRSWLNDEFLNKAFTEKEQGRIRVTELTNPGNPVHGTPGGNNTWDRIFLLSVDEVISLYDFNSWYEDENEGYCEDLIVTPTYYAKAHRVDLYVLEELDYTGIKDNKAAFYWRGLAYEGYSNDCVGRWTARWWLRSPGTTSDKACCVWYGGNTGWGDSDESVCSYYLSMGCPGVRPALYIER